MPSDEKMVDRYPIPLFHYSTGNVKVLVGVSCPSLDHLDVLLETILTIEMMVSMRVPPSRQGNRYDRPMFLHPETSTTICRVLLKQGLTL